MKMNMTAGTTLILTALCLSAIPWGCSPQGRTNPLDPGGTAYRTNTVTNTTPTPSTVLQPGFLPGTPSIAAPSNLWGNTLGLAWPSASNVASYRVYVSTNSTRPASATLDNLTATNGVLTLAGVGQNNIWIEAVPTTNGTVSAFMETNWVVRSGWKIDTTVGGTTTPSLRCINVPPGQTRTISFPGNIGMNMVPMSVASALRTQSVSGNLDVVVMLTNGSYSCPWTNSVGNLASFTTYFGLVVGGTPPMGACQVVISVKNISDTDAFNAVWVDDIDVMTAIYSESFMAIIDSQLTGHTEN